MDVSKDEFLRLRREVRGIDKTSIGLENLTNDAQVKKIASCTDGNLMAWDGADGDRPRDSNININDIISGWIPVKETWNRTGSNAFTVAGNATDRYQAKDKFKLTQDNTVKHGYFVKVSYNPGTGLTTVNTSLESALTDSVISNAYCSKIATPQGFPYDKALLWTGSWSGGSITVTGIGSFTRFTALMEGLGTVLNIDLMKGGSMFYWRGTGGYVSTTPTMLNYHAGATIPFGGSETLTMEGCKSVRHYSSGSHDSYAAQTIVGIFGLV